MPGLESSIQVKFLSNDSKYAQYIPSASIMVPTKLKRFGLSEIINMLCQSENIPFDFIIDRNLLTTSLSKYIERNNVSLETVLEIQVVKSLSPPKAGHTLSHNDWIGSVKTKDQSILTGSYDGHARVWNLSGECEAILKIHEGPVKCVAWTGSDSLLTAAQDGIVCGWKVCTT
jgi:ribosome biogenesis protein YTM1